LAAPESARHGGCGGGADQRRAAKDGKRRRGVGLGHVEDHRQWIDRQCATPGRRHAPGSTRQAAHTIEQRHAQACHAADPESRRTAAMAGIEDLLTHAFGAFTGGMSMLKGPSARCPFSRPRRSLSGEACGSALSAYLAFGRGQRRGLQRRDCYPSTEPSSQRLAREGTKRRGEWPRRLLPCSLRNHFLWSRLNGATRRRPARRPGRADGWYFSASINGLRARRRPSVWIGPTSTAS